MRKNFIENIDWCKGMQALPDKSVHCIVTSPPYWGLRNYGVKGQLGLEKTPEEYLKKIVEGFSIAKDKLRDDGTLWLNLGDSYAGSGKAKGDKCKNSYKQDTNRAACIGSDEISFFRSEIYKPKDLIGIPWMVAFALRAAGWYLRQDIIWHKPNPMPESVTDRCTKAHEYIFLFSKSQKYYYNQDAILKDASANTHARLNQDIQNQIGSARANGALRHNGNMKPTGRKLSRPGEGIKNNTSFDSYMAIMPLKVNKKSVWTVPTQSFSEAHFATFPEELIIDCIKAGCPNGGIVLDPFMGAGTTALVAQKINRNFIGFELNPEYINIANRRLKKELGLFHPENLEHST